MADRRFLSVDWARSGRGYLAAGPGFVAASTGGAPPGGAAGVGPTFTNLHNGPVLVDAVIQPVFWGTGWSANTEPFSTAAFMQNLRTMAATPYFGGLDEYGCTGTVTVRDELVWDDDDIVGIAATVSGRNGAVTGRLLSLVDAKLLPEPDQAPAGLIYAVVLSSRASLTVGDGSGKSYVGWNGYATWLDLDLFDIASDELIHWLWVGTAGAAGTGKYSSLQYATKVIAHEIVERMTDPGIDDGWRDATGDQIGDPAGCNTAAAVVDGVAVQAYWSQHLGRPTLPHRVRDTFPQVSPPERTVTKGDPKTETKTIDCGIPTPLQLGYTIDSIAQRSTVDAGPQGFDDPVVTFSLFGANLAAGSGSTQGKVSVAAPDGTVVDAVVTVDHAVAGNRITLTSASVEGAYSLDLGIAITERPLDSDPVPVAATASVALDFLTQAKTYDQGSQDRLDACDRQAARLHAGALEKAFGKRPPGGDPPDRALLEQEFDGLLAARASIRARGGGH